LASYSAAQLTAWTAGHGSGVIVACSWRVARRYQERVRVARSRAVDRGQSPNEPARRPGRGHI
jgi:hypothetical protein